MMQQISGHTHFTFSILDAARIFGEMETAQTLQTNFLNLYMGKGEEYLSSVAPHLFEYQPESEFGKWLLDKGWGNSWGVFIETNDTLEELQKHFRKYLMVKTEEGREMYFRFYDPRVLRVFLPTCDAAKLKDFFGPVKVFGMEDEDPQFAVEFIFEDGKLITRKISKLNFWNKLNGIQVESMVTDEVKSENPGDKNDKPGRKWNFLID